MTMMEKLDKKYQEFETAYESSTFAMKFLVWVGVALTLMTLGSVLVPAIYSAGQEFGEFLYSVFG
ncbi:TPA: hypothetical protein ACGO21_001168 [Streptococcus suis]|uniref:hypothetical protein n=1 Tax=Streptococcus suis TaxID=1307 RepID=UPI000415E671|nr:hypothetical protein [Streptococcus suis]MDW8682119.1 hypothetical protein [Streptococcus suis]MDW8759163.1 hypothetical protein [Streptococcus suis]HEL1591644.1 hypothetical protein [Streptococcus suis]HEL1602001.1 hypothetical protein [Streptococcus suis]HEL1838088.1 hypothetical protein [Streptococcus suis]